MCVSTVSGAPAAAAHLHTPDVSPQTGPEQTKCPCRLLHGIVQRGAESWVMARMMTVLLDLHDITSLYSVPPVKDSVTESPDDKRNQHHRCELRSCWLQQTEAPLCF